MKKFLLLFLAFCLLFSFAQVSFSMGETPSQPSGVREVSDNTGVPSRTPLQSLLEKKKKSQTVYITKTGKKYHRVTCRYLKYSSIPIDLANAKSIGYEPC